MPFIQYDHKPLFFTLRRSERAKRLHIVARAQFFEVVAPKRVTNQAILQFITEHRPWMGKQLTQQLKKSSQQASIWPLQFLANEQVPYRGAQLSLVVIYGASASIERQGDKLIVCMPWQTHCAALESEIKKQLLIWYQQQAMTIIQACATVFCTQLGRWPKALHIKQQKSRWGSCGITQKIYLNWLLVLAPPGVLEYVVAHELGHLFYRNHGPRFWAKVAECMADFKEQDRWLNRNGQQLKLPSHW